MSQDAEELKYKKLARAKPQKGKDAEAFLVLASLYPRRGRLLVAGGGSLRSEPLDEAPKFDLGRGPPPSVDGG